MYQQSLQTITALVARADEAGDRVTVDALLHGKQEIIRYVERVTPCRP